MKTEKERSAENTNEGDGLATYDLTPRIWQETAAENLAVVNFWAAWCGHCKMQCPIIDGLAEEMTDVKFCKVNVDEQGALSGQYKIRSIPTIVFFKDGKPVEQSVGMREKKELRAIIEMYK